MKALIVNYDEVPWIERPSKKGIHSKLCVINSVTAGLVKWDKGVQWGPNSHPEEQFNYIVKGKIEFIIKDDAGERKFLLTEGMAIALEPFVRHGARALEDTISWQACGPCWRFRELSRECGLLVNDQTMA